jgi:hypothetical protein
VWFDHKMLEIETRHGFLFLEEFEMKGGQSQIYSG